jgi:gliding motility-associated-like protein
LRKNNYIIYIFSVCFLGLLILFPQVSKSQAGSWAWAKGVHTTNPEFINDVAVDPVSGDVVAVGVFNGGLNIFYGLNFLGANGGGFVVKYSANGSFIWAFPIGNNKDDACNSVAIDAAGNIYVTGYIQNTADFKGTGLISQVLNGTGQGKNMFIAKFNSSGNYVWANQGGGALDDEGYAVAVNSNRVFVTGYFTNSASFSGIPTGSNRPNENAFFVSYDLSGSVQWEADAGSGQSCFGRGITADNNNVYIVGDYKGAAMGIYKYSVVGVKDDSLLNVNPLTENIFLLSLAVNGPYAWADSIQSVGADFGRDVAQNAVGVFVTGSTSSGASFPGYAGNPVAATALGLDMFISKHDKGTGNASVVKSEAGPDDEEGTSLAIDTVNTICVSGYFKSSLSFGGGPTINSTGSEEIFVANYSAFGVNWVKQAGAAGKDIPHGITINSSGDVFVGGEYQSNAAFGTVVLPANSPPNIFVAKIGCLAIGNDTITAPQTICVNQIPDTLKGSTPTGGASPYTYLWQQSPNNSVWSNASGTNNTKNYSPPALAANTYYRRIVSSGGACGSPDTSTNILITVNPLPAVTANATATVVCIGTNVTLTGGGASTYTWSSGVTDGVSFVPASTQTYTVTGTDINGCTNSATQTITVNSLPTVTANTTATVVCAGTSVTLTGGGASTYTWSSGVTDGVSFVPASTQAYTVTGTDVNGCTNTATQTITVNSLPGVTANATSTVVCAGTSVTLTGGGASTYTWSNGVTDGVPFVPASTQTYTVTGTGLNGCTNSAIQTVSVNALPTVIANATSTVVCIGTSVTLTGSGASIYSWSNGVTDGVSFIPPATRTYTVTGKDVNGCVNTDTKKIIVNSLPAVTANATSTVVCNGTSVTLTGGGANTYTWSGGVIDGISFIPASTQTYTVTGTDLNGCINSATKTVTVNSLPSVTANATSTVVCMGGSVTLTGGGGTTTYTWSSGVSDGISFIPSSTQNYTVTGTGANGCTNSDTITVTANPLPMVTANATSTVVCVGTSVTLTGGGAAIYSWSGGVTDGISFVPPATRTYTVTGKDINGCTNTATQMILVNSLPNVMANATATLVCAGTSVTLTGGGANTYTWTGGVSNGVSFAAASTQTYTVTGTDLNGCKNNATKTITVNPLPPVTAHTTANAICTGTSITLTGTGAVTYAWSNGVTDGVSFIPASTQVYTVTGTDANGCTNSATQTITVNSLPTLNANATSTVVCAGTSITLTGTGASTYTWSSGVSNGVSFVPASTQTYTVIGSDVNGCTNSATKLITVNPLPTITVVATTTLVCFGNTTTLTGLGANTYTWVGGISNGVPFTPASTQTYNVFGTDVKGCMNSAAQTITVTTPPTISFAGNNQSTCSTTVTLSANNPTTGTGSWTTISGTGIITATNSPNSGVTNLSVGQNIFMWTISNGACPVSTSTVSITSDANPSIPNAGSNQDLCVQTSTTLSANNPGTGTGVWSLVSGSGTVTPSSSPNAAVSGLSIGQNIFMWTISNGVCPSATGTVSIQVDAMPTTANAGTDISTFAPNTNMAANTPLIGTGVWSLLSGGGTISSGPNPVSSITDLPFGQSTFMWTISNGVCPASKDNVVVTLLELVVPNGFSPNGDGMNDFFEIPGITEYANVKLDVFNRWGNLVYQNNEYKNNWSGRNTSGELLSDDTYFYTLEIPNKKTIKGFVILKNHGN